MWVLLSNMITGKIVKFTNLKMVVGQAVARRVRPLQWTNISDILKWKCELTIWDGVHNLLLCPYDVARRDIFVIPVRSLVH